MPVEASSILISPRAILFPRIPPAEVVHLQSLDRQISHRGLLSPIQLAHLLVPEIVQDIRCVLGHDDRHVPAHPPGCREVEMMEMGGGKKDGIERRKSLDPERGPPEPFGAECSEPDEAGADSR